MTFPDLTLEPLELDQAHVWIVPLDEPQERYESCRQLINAEEWARAERFVTQELRQRFVICRGQLRRLLGRYLDVDADAVRFAYSQWGKPTLENSPPGREGIHFNVSHSGDWALIALACSPIGVDLEAPNRRVRYRSIASQVLSPEEHPNWNAMSAVNQELATMHLWVCKEAILKALGLGIAEGLRKISFPMPPPTSEPFAPTQIDSSLLLHLDDDGSCRMNSWTDVTTWRVRLLDAIVNCNSALATQRHVNRISLHRIERSI